MTGDANRRGWAAMLFPSGITDVIGAVRGSPRLHWTQRAAQAEAQAWVTEMGHGQIIWESLDDQMAIGRIPGHAAVVRSILLPLDAPEGNTMTSPCKTAPERSPPPRNRE
jgi:hypothetical protein